MQNIQQKTKVSHLICMDDLKLTDKTEEEL